MSNPAVVIGGPFVGASIFGFIWPNLQLGVTSTLLQIPVSVFILAGILFLTGVIRIRPLMIPGALATMISGGFALGLWLRTSGL